MKSARLLICGDLVITDDKYSKDKIDKQIVELFSSSDWNIANLECPVTSVREKEKIKKTGPHLKGAAVSIAQVLKTLNVNLVTLANNHILDYGEKGLIDTLSFCKENNIETVGAGIDVEAAKKSIRKTINGHKIAIVNFAENEWASADKKSAGANPMDLIDNVKQIQAEKAISDIVIVIVHGGHEYYNLPSPRMQKQYRFYAEQGADIVVGHHTHCVNGHEVHNGIPIYYSTGNFLFTKPSSYEDWYKGIVLDVCIDEHRKISAKVNFVIQEKSDYSLRLANGKEDEELKNRFKKYSNIISDSDSLSKFWDDYLDHKSATYLNYWSPVNHIKNKFFRKVFLKLGLNGATANGFLLHLNLMRCEAHYDLSKEILKRKIDNYKSKRKRIL
jgi:hypothetical protein